MNRVFYFAIITAMALSVFGCARIKEAVKVLWGSSTQALEDARHQGVSKNYSCNIELCFEDILEIAKKEDLKVFIKDRKQWLIVVMGLKDSIETTEIGFFFSAIGSKETRIEVVSLSDYAQHNTADLFFTSLDKIYPEQK